MKKVKFVIRIPKNEDISYLPLVLADSLFYEGVFAKQRCQILFSNMSVTESSNGVRYCTLFFNVGVEGENYSEQKREQLSRLVFEPFIEWAKEEVRALIQRGVVRRDGFINDAVIEQFVADKGFRINKDGTVEVLGITGWEKRRVWFDSGKCLLKYKNKNLSLGRIIYRAFNGKLESNLVVIHKDGNRLNFSSSNLALARSAVKVPATVKGNCVLSQANVDRIKVLRKNGLTYTGILQACIDEKIPIKSKGHLSDIFSEKIWK